MFLDVVLGGRRMWTVAFACVNKRGRGCDWSKYTLARTVSNFDQPQPQPRCHLCSCCGVLWFAGGAWGLLHYRCGRATYMRDDSGSGSGGCRLPTLSQQWQPGPTTIATLPSVCVVCLGVGGKSPCGDWKTHGWQWQRLGFCRSRSPLASDDLD